MHNTISQQRKLLGYLRGTAGRGETWLQSHLNLILLVGIAVGFLVRATVAYKSYLNPDEALHYLLANQPSLGMVYRAGLTNAHPPFLFFLLHFWRFLGNSEFLLRLPSALAGTVFPWVVFKWLGEIFGKRAGLFAFILLEFSPTMIVLSAEVRGYTLLLLFMAGALYFVERAFRENSPLMMWAFSLFLYLAIVTEYSTLWFTLAIGVYAFRRICSERLAKKVIWIWAGGQLVALALCAFLYVTHISKLRGSPMEHEAMRGWLNTSYFHFGRDRLLPFILGRTVGVFLYAVSQNALGITVLILFVLGVRLLLLEGSRPTEGAPRSREFAILLLLPFAIGSAAGITRVYPYGYSRHNVYLALFAVAGASILFGLRPGKKLWPSFLAAISIVAIANLHPEPIESIQSQDQARMLMEKAVKDIHQSIAPQGPILVDYETSILLRYYLCRTQVSPVDEAEKGSPESDCGGYRLISTAPSIWAFTTETFPAALDTMANTSGLKPGDRAWVVHAGWGGHVCAQLVAQFPELSELPYREFGANICLIQVRIGEVRPAAGTVKIRSKARFALSVGWRGIRCLMTQSASRFSNSRWS